MAGIVIKKFASGSDRDDDALTNAGIVNWLEKLSDEREVKNAPAPATGTAIHEAVESLHGTMEVQEGEGPKTMTTATAETIKIQSMTRRTGATGAHGIYAEWRDPNGDLLRGFLAANFCATSTLAVSAKGARWTVQEYADAESARNAFADYFGSTATPLALVCELTGGDVDRIRRGVIPSLFYPASGFIEEAAKELAGD